MDLKSKASLQDIVVASCLQRCWNQEYGLRRRCYAGGGDNLMFKFIQDL